MPCRCDYMEPNQREKELSELLSLWEEVETGKLGKHFEDGMHPKAYNQTITQKKLDKATRQLCTFLKTQSDKQLQAMSLEMQMWWREHKKADKEREELESKIKKEKKEAKALEKKILSKLSSREKELYKIMNGK